MCRSEREMDVNDANTHLMNIGRLVEGRRTRCAALFTTFTSQRHRRYDIAPRDRCTSLTLCVCLCVCVYVCCVCVSVCVRAGDQLRAQDVRGVRHRPAYGYATTAASVSQAAKIAQRPCVFGHRTQTYTLACCGGLVKGYNNYYCMVINNLVTGCCD